MNIRIADIEQSSSSASNTDTYGVYGENATRVIQNQTVAFRDEIQPVRVDKTYVPNQIDPLLHENIDHSIFNFLERPQVIENFKWADTQAVLTNIGTLDPFALLMQTYNVYSKLLGFRYFKADVEFTLQVNAQPFQQGGLLLWHRPLFNSPSYNNVTLQSMTGCHSTVFNLADAHTLKFTVPYTNPYSYIDLVQPPENPLGFLFLTVYAQLATGTVEGTVYAHFKNIQVMGPSQYQLSVVPPALQAKKDENFQSKYSLRYEPQVGTEAETMQSSGVVTQKGVVARAANMVASVLPAVGSAFPAARIVTTPLSWVATALGSVASLFGWSKPLTVQTTTIMRQKTAKYMNNYDGIDLSDNLGLACDNSIQQMPLFGTVKDEMSFDHLLSIYNYMATFNWNTTQDVGTVLFTTLVSPVGGSVATSVVSGSNQLYYYDTTYLGFISRFFDYWSGDIAYQFRAFKTNFHSGRLRIKWNPGLKGTELTNTDSMVYSVVWDVRTQHTTSVVVPYLFEKPWCKSPVPLDGSQPAEYNGTLTVEVLNRLVAGSSAPTTLTINVEHKGVPGSTSFAAVRDPEIQPVTTVAPHVYAPSTFPTPSLEAQVGDDSGLTLEQSYISRSVNNRALMSSEAASVGEVVVSFRQLIKRFTYFTPVLHDSNEFAVNCAPVDTEAPGMITLTFTPFQFTPTIPAYSLLVGTNQGLTIPNADLISIISAPFAYFRGSMRLKFAYPGSIDTDYMITKLVPQSEGVPLDTATVSIKQLLPKRSAQIVTYNRIEGFVEVQAPFYNEVTHIFVKDDPTQSPYTRWPPQVMIIPFTTTLPNLNTIPPLVYRACGDDATFGFLVGVPRCQTSACETTGYAVIPPRE